VHRALIRFANSGRAFNSVTALQSPVAKMNRIVRAGPAPASLVNQLLSVRATSRIVTHPLALSLAPAADDPDARKCDLLLLQLRIGPRNSSPSPPHNSPHAARLHHHMQLYSFSLRQPRFSVRAVFSETMNPNVCSPKTFSDAPSESILISPPPTVF